MRNTGSDLFKASAPMRVIHFNIHKLSTMKCTSIAIRSLLFAFCFSCCSSASLRLFFAKCGDKGFTCTLNGGKYNITYRCPAITNDVTLFLWDFRSPSNIERLTVSNCKILRLSFTFYNVRRPLTHFHVVNITEINIIKSSGNVLNPPNVIFEDIDNIEYIPERTFLTQAKTAPKLNTPVGEVIDFQNLHFNRVNIGTIGMNAFWELKWVQNFTWNQVKVKRIQHLGLQMEHEKSGNFSIINSELEVIEPLAFKIQTPIAEFVGNKFVDISPSGINGSIGNFTFAINTVNNLQANAISILSENVVISDNRFEYLRSGALERISPGLLKDSQRNFGTLRFVYEFTHNNVNFLDAGSLNPDMSAYENVATDLKFSRNALYCSCENLGWLLSGTGHGYGTALLTDFYETITEEEFENVCSFTSCQLPLKKAENLVVNGKCAANMTAEALCSPRVKSTTGIPKLMSTTKAPAKIVQKAKSTGCGIFASFILVFIALILFQV